MMTDVFPAQKTAPFVFKTPFLFPYNGDGCFSLSLPLAPFLAVFSPPLVFFSLGKCQQAVFSTPFPVFVFFYERVIDLFFFPFLGVWPLPFFLYHVRGYIFSFFGWWLFRWLSHFSFLVVIFFSPRFFFLIIRCYFPPPSFSQRRGIEPAFPVSPSPPRRSSFFPSLEFVNLDSIPLFPGIWMQFPPPLPRRRTLFRTPP